MDGKGRWMDNVFIERLNAFETGSEARAGIGNWTAYYNADRPHSSVGERTPDEAYAGPTPAPAVAA